MKISVFLLSLVAMTFFTNAAFGLEKGGLFVEPMVTWERGRGDVNFPAPINSSDTEIDGFGVGARVGFHILESVFLAADGRYSIPNFKGSALNQDVSAKAWNVGPVVGVQMPTIVGLRVWGGWILAGEVDPDKDRGVDEQFKSGAGFRIGAGFKVAMTSLNVEYQKVKYDNTVLQEVGVFTPNYNRSDVELTNESMILSVSFPITI